MNNEVSSLLLSKSAFSHQHVCRRSATRKVTPGRADVASKIYTDFLSYGLVSSNTCNPLRSLCELNAPRRRPLYPLSSALCSQVERELYMSTSDLCNPKSCWKKTAWSNLTTSMSVPGIERRKKAESTWTTWCIRALLWHTPPTFPMRWRFVNLQKDTGPRVMSHLLVRKQIRSASLSAAGL